MSQLPYDIKLKCGKAKKGQDNSAALDFRSLLKHVGAFSKKMAHSLSFTVGDRIMLEVETSNEVTKGEWQKAGKKVCENNRIRIIQQGCRRRLIIDSCILSDDANFSYVCGTERSDCEVFVRDLPCTIIVPLEDTQMIVGQQVIMTAKLSVAGAKARLFHEGSEVKMSKDVTYFVKDKLFEFRIDKLKYDHAGFYQLKTNGDECLAELIVEDKPIDFSSGFSDLTVNCTEYAEFKCQVNDPEIEGRWYKDGIPIVESERIKFVNDGCLRKICIYDVRTSDIGEYEYRCKSGKTELSMTACLDAIELVVEKPKEPPKIYLNLNENRENLFAMFVESASIEDFSVVAVELSEEIRFEYICELADRSLEQLAADVAKKTWEELQSTARTICNSLAQVATEDPDFVFPQNHWHGEKKKAYDRNVGVLRKALRKLPEDGVVRLIRVSVDKEPSQSRKRKTTTIRDLPDVDELTIDSFAFLEDKLNKHQLNAILMIANAQSSSFRELQLRKVAEICNETPPTLTEEETLSSQLEEVVISQPTSSYSQELPKEKVSSIIDRVDLKESCLLLSTEKNIAPAVINDVIVEVFQNIPDAIIEPFTDRSLRNHLPLVQPLQHQQEIVFIEEATSLSIGLDSTTISGIEYSSLTILSSDGDSLFWDIKKVADHSGATVADQFNSKMKEYPEDIQRLIAEKTQSLHSDRAPAAKKSVEIIKKSLDKVCARDRVYIPCSMHIPLNCEKGLRASMPKDILDQVALLEKVLSSHRLHQTKSSKGADFLTFLKAKKLGSENVLLESLALYSNVRFSVFAKNLENVLINLPYIEEFLSREGHKTTSKFITDNKQRFQVELLAAIFVYKNVVAPWWEKVRAKSDVEYYETLKQELDLTFEGIISAASPFIVVRSKSKNLMLQNDGETTLFKAVADSIQKNNFKELNDAIKSKAELVKNVFHRFRIQDDTTPLIGEVTWTNQLAEMSMGALKRIYGIRFNLNHENLALAGKSSYNRPISFWRERDASKIEQVFKRGTLKRLSDARKRRKESADAAQIEAEIKRQKKHKEETERETKLLADIHDYIPMNLDSAHFKQMKKAFDRKAKVTTSAKEFRALCIMKMRECFDLRQNKEAGAWEDKNPSSKEIDAYNSYLLIFRK
ncbi:Oidioi.mRNA.OKI2018_I69.PAR.g10195.t1.cds [Oikopleura dioica]|uniref:Oidioi.mRNA.OKI2018_I69.PAR.g10195.t1.cds n=1 Tax=Oikopleura dioica TaxID=34765 RepID=A0ABN7RPD4_OIKDI|nr:Oidioi.mRNA.OKI2018_I69.PAR.g10195.t1.cds [Oikopleura dioica]